MIFLYTTRSKSRCGIPCAKNRTEITYDLATPLGGQHARAVASNCHLEYQHLYRAAEVNVAKIQHALNVLSAKETPDIAVHIQTTQQASLDEIGAL